MVGTAVTVQEIRARPGPDTAAENIWPDWLQHRRYGNTHSTIDTGHQK